MRFSEQKKLGDVTDFTNARVWYSVTFDLILHLGDALLMRIFLQS